MLEPKIYGTGEKVILSVEDDDAAYYLLELAFGDVHGDYRLYRVEDGGEALGFLRRSGPYETMPKPNLVLLNLNMPRVSGFDVLEAIKNDATMQQIPCVVFSSSSLDKDKARCLALGARAFVTKPTDIDDFLIALSSACSLIDT
jgi:CheY-like chemotaxis protein